MKELECTKAALTQTKLDLDNECDARRRLQQEVQEGREWKERQGRRPFVVALIDADADGYVVSKFAQASLKCSQRLSFMTISLQAVPRAAKRRPTRS